MSAPGAQVISLSEPNSKVVTDLDFGDMGGAVAIFDLVENNGKTSAIWGFSTDMGNNPIGRWMA